VCTQKIHIPRIRNFVGLLAILDMSLTRKTAGGFAELHLDKS
jgi:hypothetical protein